MSAKIIQLNKFIQFDTDTVCCVCDTPVVLPETVKGGLRKSGRVFYCIWGHALCFRAKPDQSNYDDQLQYKDQQIKKLESQIAKLSALIPWFRKKKLMKILITNTEK
jgi:hypothetical protein